MIRNGTMALVVLLKGVNVGGHRTFRPSILATQLKRFAIVNVGAAGTFVVHNAVSRSELREQIARRLPFVTDVMICDGSDILRLVAQDPFARHASCPDVVQFVSVLAKRRAPASRLPVRLPPEGPWTLTILAQQDRFVLGIYRREMKAIRYLDRIETIFGAPCTTRSWSTILAIGKVLRRQPAS
jgi:uncharacterized protein (DUF1697 family)